MSAYKIPKAQTVALVRQLGGPVDFVDDYPVKMPGRDEVLAKVLYTGVCQSGSSNTINMSNFSSSDFVKISTLPEGQLPGPTASPSQPSNSLTLAATKASVAWSPLAQGSRSMIHRST